MRFFRAMAGTDPVMRMALLLTSESLDHPPTRILAAETRRRLSEFDAFRRYREMYDRFKHLDTVQRMLYIDTEILLPDTYLEKVDKATMAHGIEIRVPFLDADLSAYAMGLPSSYKVKRAQKKWILRRALRGIVPDSILDGPKTGFGVPYEYWLRGPLSDYMRSVLLDTATLNWGIFDRKALEICIDEHVREQRNNGFLLYSLLNLALWRKFYLT
jgi:asparagine synthase (glutamine-hydrolysing)